MREAAFAGKRIREKGGRVEKSFAGSEFFGGRGARSRNGGKEIPREATFRGLDAGQKNLRRHLPFQGFKERLLSVYENEPVGIKEIFYSSDGTEKYLFSLADGNLIEGVLMKYKYGYTQCVSTQVGCRMGCKFCASTLNGLVRNLSAGEILSQILVVNALHGEDFEAKGRGKEARAVTNVVLMGSGEPLDNYDETVKFLRNATAAEGLNISARNISLSTCGLVPKMYALANEGIPLNLTVSLHATSDEDRARVMPVAKAYKIEEILKACAYYFEKTGRRYYFEYNADRGRELRRGTRPRAAFPVKGKALSRQSHSAQRG